MLLTKVLYEPFESDAKWLDLNDKSSHHIIDRELRLLFTDAPPVFISWTSTPVQYSIGHQGQSFFANEPQVVRDMTGSAIWSRVIDQQVALDFDDPDHQVLRIHAGAAAVYCSSFEEGWQTDVVNVSSEAPNKAMQTDAASRRL